jgi:MFS family permease
VRSTRDIRLLLTGNTLSALGTGFTLPFLFIYLTDVRGISVQTASLVIAWIGVVGMLSIPVGGALVDRFGASKVLIVTLTVEGIGALSLAAVSTVPQALLAVTATGLGGSAAWSAQSALVATIVPPEGRPRVFALQFALLNLGIGLGGAVGGLLVNVDDPTTFQVVYVVDSMTFFAYAVILVLGLRHVGPVPPEDDEAGEVGPGGYREVLGDRRMRRVCAVTLVLLVGGYAQAEAGLPAFATREADVSTRVLGVAFLANTMTIVIAQLGVQRWLTGKRRTRATAGVAGLWGASWLVLGAAGLGPGTFGAQAAVVTSLSLFALGETLQSPTGPSLVNDLAPAHLRGRYNAVYSLTWNSSMILGPLLAGTLLGAGLAPLYVATLVGLCAAAALLAIRLERHLTPAENGQVPTSSPEPVAVG